MFTWVLFKPDDPAPLVDPGETGFRVAEGNIVGNFFPADVEGPRPAILLLGGSEGGIGRDVQRQALLLQQQGYSVLHLGYLNVPNASSQLERVPLQECLQRCFKQTM